MSRLDYRHSIGGRGVSQGLPLRRGSHLYDVEPKRRYPDVFSTGTTQGSQHQYDKGVFHLPPHLPITFMVGPYVSNHNAPGSGNFTRRQYFVVKRGQPMMSVAKDEPAVGVFVDDNGSATIEDRTYVDPAELATNGRITGFNKPDTYQLKETNDAGSDAETVISKSDYESLPGTSAGSPAQDDYKEVTEDDPVDFERYAALSDEKQHGFRSTFTDLEDNNDRIATGGTNMYAQVDEALFGETDMVEHVEIDADNYFFGTATQSQGFLLPSTGGAERTVYFNEMDREAGVTLPTKGDGNHPQIVEAIGNVTDVSADNVSEWGNSAVHFPAKRTHGVMHTDLEQSLSHQHFHFATGTPATGPRSVVNTGEINIPFVDISKLEQIINNRSPLTYGDDFNFTDQTEGRSGIKTGIYNEQDISAVNKASFLSDNDKGYANLYYNFAAPFLTTDRKPRPRQDFIKPDLFAEYTLADNGIIEPGAGTGASNAFGLDQSEIDANANGDVDMKDLGLRSEVIGKVLNVYDMPRKTLEQLRINPIWQSRLQDPSEQGYTRLGGSADTKGVQQILADFVFMLLGGSNKSWASSLLVQFDGLNQDIANVLEELVVEGAVGMAEIRFDTAGVNY